MKRNRTIAAVASASLAIAGAAALTLAPAAQATYTGTHTLGGVYYLNGIGVNQYGTLAHNYTDTFTITTTPSTATLGTSVTTTVSGATGPIDTLYARSANTIRVSANFKITTAGGSTQWYAQSSGNTYPASAVAAGVAEGAWSVSSTYSWPVSGDATVALTQITFDDAENLGPGYGIDRVYQDANTCRAGVTTISGVSCPTGEHGGTATNGSDPALGGTVVSPDIVDTVLDSSVTATLVSVNAQNPGVQAMRHAYGTDTVMTITGRNWPASLSTSAGWAPAMCDVDGTNCDGTYIPSLSTDASGNLSGTVTSDGYYVYAHTPGAHLLKIAYGSTSYTIPVTVLGNPSISVTPASAAPGSTVSVSGSNFNPLQTVKIFGSTSTSGPFADNTSDAEVSATASSTGALPATNLTINDASTVSLYAYQGLYGGTGPANPSASTSIQMNSNSCTADTGNVATGSCDTSQTVNATLSTGSLSQAAATTGTGNPSSTQVVFCQTAAPTATTSLTAAAASPCAMGSPSSTTSMFGSLNPITVVDTRGGAFGWSLTARMTDLSDGATGSMVKSRMSISPTCSGATGSASGATAGAASQSFASTVGLCTKNTTADSAGGTSGGTWTVGAPLVLSVPAYQAAGSYTSIITINLS